MDKSRLQKLRLAKETLMNSALATVQGGFTAVWPCPAPVPETRGFTNCDYCY